MKNNTTTNPFAFAEMSEDSSKTRRLDFTPVLQDKSRARATEMIKLISSERTDLADLANTVLDNGDPNDLLTLINSVYTQDQIVEDASVLDECPADDLAKMLESQRSNRSKAKKAGLRSRLTNTVAYFSAMYAELMIRVKTGKAYSGSNATGTLDLDALSADPDALNKKIASLASKQSRLSKIAKYDEDAKRELEETREMLNKLRSLRPNQPVTTAIKNIKVDELRAALAKLDTNEIPEELRALIEKIS